LKLISGRPNINNKVLDEKGNFRHVWYLFMLQIWQKLGGEADRINDSTPTGSVQGFAGNTAPTGWLLCDGSDVSRTTYEALFNIIGETFGAGDGSTTFALPDCRGRTLVGSGTGAGLSSRTIGDTFGEETHTQTIAEMAQHNHPVTDAGHTHPATGNFVNDSTGTEYSTATANKGTVQAATGSATTGISVDNNGSGTPFNVIQPSIVFPVIIKT